MSDIADEENENWFMPDHGAKRQLMVPGRQLMTENDNSWTAKQVMAPAIFHLSARTAGNDLTGGLSAIPD